MAVFVTCHVSGEGIPFLGSAVFPGSWEGPGAWQALPTGLLRALSKSPAGLAPLLLTFLGPCWKEFHLF